jgi:hypothetical protein
MNWTTRNDVVQISNEEMDRKREEHPNLVGPRFSGIPFYASPDGRTLPTV